MKKPVNITLEEELLDVLNEAKWNYRVSLSKFIEALIIEGGKRLKPPLPYTPKTPDNQNPA